MITFPAYVSQVRTMADGSLRITFDTQELSPDKMAAMFSSLKELGVVAFAPAVSELTNEDLKLLDNVDKHIKEGQSSPSQLMRNALFGLWQRTQFDGGEDDIPPFDKWYREKILEWVEIIKKK